MARARQQWNRIFARDLRPAAATGLLLTAVFGLTAAITQPAVAQTYTVIHNFTGGQDGATPMAGLTKDQAGNLYGTAAWGGHSGGNCGIAGCGTVFRLANRNSGWVLTPLYSFVGGDDGANPEANVVIGVRWQPVQHHVPGRGSLR